MRLRGLGSLVAQILPRWNRLQPWFELVESVQGRRMIRPAQRFTLFYVVAVSREDP